jgi:CHAT domain-containing protein
LNKRGYEGQLNSLQFPLNQNIICQETHPKGWGFLYHWIGQAHYFQGRTVVYPRSYWKKAKNSYNKALKTLTATDYPELHLEVLQDLSSVLLALKEPEEARVLLQDGTDLLNRMLQDPNRGDYAKQQLARKFTAFNQLTVSLALQSGNLREALTLAETGKNTCLRWIWNYGDIPELTYHQIRELLALPATALIYWHLSPISLSTFLLLPNLPDPILISPLPQPNDDRDPALLQILAFEAWVKKWNEDYTNYGTKKADTIPETEAKWYADLETQLDELKSLLNIAEIEQHLQNHAINHLILIPHRDLHRFPLPTFFKNQTCTTLPSAYLGLSPLSSNWEKGRNLLIVENPRSTPKIGNTIKKLDELPFAEVESALIQQLFVPLMVGHTENDDYNPIRQGFKSLSHTKNPLKWIEEEKSRGEQESKSPKVGGFRGRIQCLPNTHATQTRVTEVLQHPHAIFHFCGHGAYHSQNPSLSCLYLNGKDTLTLKDILNLDLQAYRLIVLSACETAVTGNQTITDEYVGLVSGFLRAGASHVLSTLWTVESFATTLLTVTFYQNLHLGQPPAAALKNAQTWLKTATKSDLQTWLDDAIALLHQDRSRQRLLKVRQRNIDIMESDRPYAHPYYWSAFTLSGQ